MNIPDVFRGINDLAVKLGKFGGFPNFHAANYPPDGDVRGAILVTDFAADWADVPAAELGNPPGGDVAERFRRTHDWAVAHGYAGGYPNFHESIDSNGRVVYGTVMLTASTTDWQNVAAADLGNPQGGDVEERFRRTHDWAVANGYAGGYPNFHEDLDANGKVVYGTILLTTSAGEQVDLREAAIESQMPFGHFLPSRHGFPFTNKWPNAGLFEIDLGVASIKVGNARGGLCGGMAFAVADYFRAQVPIPAVRPDPGSRLWGFITDRFRDSFDLPTGPLKWFSYMNPARRDNDTWFTINILKMRGRDWLMLHEEWPKLRRRLDAGELVPVGWVHVKSMNPQMLGENHVVLAYRYELDGPTARVFVYDPNIAKGRSGGVDNQWFSFRTDTTEALDSVKRSTPGRPIHMFFPLDYEPAGVP